MKIILLVAKSEIGFVQSLITTIVHSLLLVNQPLLFSAGWLIELLGCNAGSGRRREKTRREFCPFVCQKNKTRPTSLMSYISVKRIKN